MRTVNFFRRMKLPIAGVETVFWGLLLILAASGIRAAGSGGISSGCGTQWIYAKARTGAAAECRRTNGCLAAARITFAIGVQYFAISVFRSESHISGGKYVVVRRLGCDLVQGNLYAGAGSPEDVTHLLHQWKAA